MRIENGIVVTRNLEAGKRRGGEAIRRRNAALHHMRDAVKVRCELLLNLDSSHLLEITAVK